jgi:dehydrogenase/reductase SDR family protein 1
MKKLDGKVAVVTGASRGIGKGIALELGVAGATVYVTGRTVDDAGAPLPGTVGATAEEVTQLGGHGIAVPCDHGEDEQIETLFARVREEQGRIDILVNNVFTAPGQSIFGGSFWDHPASLWDDLFHVGCRAHYIASHAVAPMMVERKEGLIINISSFAGAAYVFNVVYGVGKAAVDRMAKDMAVELAPHQVTCVSFWPGVVRTERMVEMSKADEVPFTIDKAETPRFTGRGVVALATDPKRLEKTGQALIVYEMAREYGFRDIDGNLPGDLKEQMGF